MIMNLRLFLLIHLTGIVHSMIYQEVDGRDTSNRQIIYEEENIQSKISCIHKCLRFKCDAFYDQQICRCLSRSRINTAVEVNGRVEGGTYLKYIGNTNLLKVRNEEDIYDVINISKDNQIGTISRITKEYHIRIFFKCNAIKMTQNTWYNLFQITGGTYSLDRHPSVYFRKEDSKTIVSRISVTLNGLFDFWTDTRHDIAWFNDWNQIDVSQKNTAKEYKFRILINDVEIRNAINNKPTDFTDMKVYASNKFHSAAEEGQIKIKFIKGYQGVKIE